MKALLSAIVLLLAFTFCVKAQTYESQPFDIGIVRDFPWGENNHDDLNLTSYDKDPSANAVVLKEFGKAWITSNGNATSMIFEYHVKIKLFNNKEFKKGHIEVPYYIQDGGSYEEINPSSVKGATYYITTDGTMHSVDLSPDSVSVIKKNKHWSAVVFNLPMLSKGCVIEYKYRLTSPFIDKFKTWEFQSDIPKMYSEYEVRIPSVFGYNISLRGMLSLTKDTVSVEKNCFESTNLRSDCSVEDYRIDNVPAFKAEPFMLSPKNYLSALYFQVTQATRLNNFVLLNQSTQNDVAGDWTDVDKSLKYNDMFGSQLSHGSSIKDKIDKLTNHVTDTLEAAKLVYAFIQKNITFDGLNNIYADNGIKKAIDKHSGNAADINLALTAALNDAGVRAYAVIISTRDNGTVNNLYPALTEFNSVITAAFIGGKVYLLDATDPLLPFGVLPFKDLNDKGRAIPLNKPSFWVKLLSSQQNVNSTVADLTLSTNNDLTGTFTCYSKSYAAYSKKAGQAAYSSSGSQTIPGLTILNSNTTGEGNSLTQTYQVKVNNQDNSGGFTFVPFMLGKPVKQPFELLDTFTDNPFTDAVRKYPVDFGVPPAYSFTVTVHLPAGYKVDNPPQNIADAVDGIGSVNATFNTDQSTATYTVTYNLEKPVYSTAEYANLRALFDKVIQAEKAPVTIKKQ